MVGNGKVAPVPTKMPKHIQMGTGFRTIPQQQQKPDLLTEAAHNLSRNSAQSVNTTTTTSVGKPEGSTATNSSNHSHGSYKMAMENIIEDYGRRGSSRKPGVPLQSQQTTNSLIGGSSSLGHSRTNMKLHSQSQHHLQELPLAVASLPMSEYPSDYGLPPMQSNPSSTLSPLPRCYSSLQPNLFPLHSTSNGGSTRTGNGNHMLLPADEQYPTLPSSFRSPYIHTADSGPSAIVYYPSKAHPIYEDLYSQVNKSGNKQQEDVYDAAGNKIDVKSQQKLSAKDAKKAIKDIEKKLKDGKKKKTLTDEEMWEMEDKLNELKEQLKGE